MPRKRPQSRRHLATRAVHAGQEPDAATGAVIPPLHLSSTYLRRDLDVKPPYDYARAINPTRRALERNLADLEGGLDARAFASGMAAIAAVMQLLGAGDHVVASEDVYGGTRRLFEGLFQRFDLTFDWVDTSDTKTLAAAIRPATRMLWIETPSNPTLRLTDLRGAARLARRHDLRLAVDNTFMSPCFQRPLELGADLVVHSTTKFLNGHSDSVGGCVVAAGEEDARELAFIQKSAGAILSPLDCFLVQRGIKTLALRMQRHDDSAGRLARWLARHPRVRKVYFPGLATHPQHRLAKRQMHGFGGVVSIDLGTRARAQRFLGRLQLFASAESLGGVESLAAHPATMTHGWLAPAERRRLGVTEGLIRLSVGVEDVADLRADLEQALGGR